MAGHLPGDDPDQRAPVLRREQCRLLGPDVLVAGGFHLLARGVG